MHALWHAWLAGIGHLLAILTSTLGGSLGLAIIATSLLVRLALLPATYRMARQGWQRQRIMQGLKPRLEALRKRHRDDSRQQLEATQALYREHGLKPIPAGGLLVALAQMPIAIGLYHAIERGVAHGARFLGLGSLAQPNLLLALGVAALTALALHLNPALPESARLAMMGLQTLITLAVVWHLASGLALYWGASSAVGVAQSLLMRRYVHRQAAATLPASPR
ncbi:YidC/Oxa1 family membrane protein insertase [Oleiagrimonas sp. C23AA]|uniref:YidC/Oxa1 family membrane protein insertase n=1 Tax=Oleiagrimonas sp. C23AA TaxID=2719047 RepID=UPI00141F50E8|nr:YidC/Oxa1 family membrane protein insertase [Oleiagrimonas sp. C23AA]NII10432.1 membrane protein insertase YidC [Oleiagrimonas sp. C23AA]